jgi:H+/Cl- antiporter ClcA
MTIKRKLWSLSNYKDTNHEALMSLPLAEQKEWVKKLFLNHFNEKYENHKNKISLMQGIVLGIVFGIFGNMAVQYSSELLAIIFESDKQAMLNASIFSFIISVIVIAGAIIYYYYSLKKEEQKMYDALTKRMEAEEILEILQKELDSQQQTP